jgi:hypothetical protein
VPGGSDGPGAENVGQVDQEGTEDGSKDAPPALKPVEIKKLAETFDDQDRRYLKRNQTPAAKAFTRLNDGLRRKASAGLAAPGRGGPGAGGGKGAGDGPGVGDGKGPGQKATLSQREKRMLRWTMRFSANNGPDYVRQLNALGAILAIPTSDAGDDHWIVRDLSMRKKPAPLLKEDVSQIKRIYWIDDKPRAVSDVMAALGLSLSPRRFVAFMPEMLENKLFEMERHHMTKVLRQTFDEDRIYETVFRVVRTGGGYRPEFERMTLKQPGM